MHLRGKRWTYWVNGYRLYVDNAWSWSGWTQERAVLNGRTIANTSGDMIGSREFELTPQDTGAYETIRIRVWSGLVRIRCRVWFGDRLIEPEAVETSVWRGQKGEWPDRRGARALA